MATPSMLFPIRSILFALAALSTMLQAADKPNVILIMADDVSWECFGSYGAEDYETPRLDALAEQGVRFSHAYSTPICTPTRVQIMSGKYSFRNYTHFGYMDPQEKTFGHLMQEAGYRTAIAGKWQLNGIYSENRGWSDSMRPLEAGFHASLLWQVTRGKRARDGGGERFWNPVLERDGKLVNRALTAGLYGPDLFADFVMDFVSENKEEPFFVYYPMVLVHDPFVPTPDSIGERPTKDANQEPKDPAAKKENFVAMVNYMDKLVGRIVDHVEAEGLLEETLIIFTADNGTHPKITSRWNGMDIKGGKGGMTDRGTHVPMIAYWKGHTPEGLVLDDLVDFTDFYPTLAELSQQAIALRDPADGVSFLPQLMGKAGTPRDWVYCHYQPMWGNKEHGQFVRDQRYKLYGDGRFYDLEEDLLESKELYGRESPEAMQRRNLFQRVLDAAPPVPDNTHKSDPAAARPTYPGVRNLRKAAQEE